MGRLSTTPSPVLDDLMTVVGVSGTPYHCPTRAAFDRHLAELRERMRRGKRFPELVKIFSADIDILLDCRELLALVSDEMGPAAASRPAQTS